jgi:myo-inositol-1(or 4)-monophosphatase
MSVDWLAFSQDAAAAVERAVAGLPTRLEREPAVGAGMGGDETTAIDAAAEAAVVARLEALHETGLDFTLISEELGERRFGGPAADGLWLVLDPIDGSMNAKRGIPFFALSLAVADGPAIGDVFFGYVRDLGNGEEWTALRGAGARLNGDLLDGCGPKDEVEILSFEATTTDLVAEKAGAMVGLAVRTRVMGSLALSLCHLAAGRLDAVCSLKPARSVDIAAAQLLVRERGLAIELPEGEGLLTAPLDVTARSRVVAGGRPDVCARLFAALQ